MTLSDSLLSYQDCTEAMEQALSDPKGGRVRFSDEASALHFRSRCHYARKLHRKMNARIYEKDAPQYGTSHYDELVLQIRTDGEDWHVNLMRMAAGSVAVEPLSEAPQIEYIPIKRLAPPETMPRIVEQIVIKRRI